MTNVPENYYGGIDIPEITEPTYWKDSEPDYNENKNLILGLGQQIDSVSAISGEIANEEKNTKETRTMLTDGAVATGATYSASGWFKFTRGVNRTIVYDLGNTSAVSGYSAGFLREDSTGVKLPAYLSFLVSENGKEWQLIKKVTAYNTNPNVDNEIIRTEGNFDKAVRARYVKVIFPVNSHVYIDEIAITGKKNVAGAAAVVPDPVTQTVYPDKFAAPEDFGGINDVLLSYICQRENDVPITKDIYLPHTAYIEDGVIKDTLFDSFMYLPYVNYLYEGYIKRPLTKADWQHYLDVQFAEGVNMDALNAAVGETKDALGLEDYKASLFLSILYPVQTQTSFGEVDGRNLDFSKLEDRKAAVKWLVDEQLRVFKEKGYDNLYIAGFYWFTEEIDYNDQTLLDLITYATDYVRSKGYITSWIPYYQASGYTDWSNLGFDLACYQPNYAFNFNIPDQRLFDAAKEAKLFGMCIELEIGGSSADHVDRLKKYYTAGYLTGYMNDAIHMYYQGGVPGSIYNAYTSEDKYINSLYKNTYEFMKGTFDPQTVSPDSQSITCERNGKANGSITVESKNTLKGYVLVTAPKYGSLALNRDGSFVYTPFKGYTGEDAFELAVDFGYAVSESAVVSVTVG